MLPDKGRGGANDSPNWSRVFFWHSRHKKGADVAESGHGFDAEMGLASDLLAQLVEFRLERADRPLKGLDLTCAA